jgi:serine/threonine protein kinase
LQKKTVIIKELSRSFLGLSEEPEGLFFAEANCGDLQHYLDTHEVISETLRLKWCSQAAEAIAYIHSKDVIHSNLRPDNYLLHNYTPEATPDLLLCDFGGSYCKIGDTIIDGGHLPDAGFQNPNKE